MKKSKKLRIWSNVVGALGSLGALAILGVGICLAGITTNPSFVPFITIGASLLTAVGAFAGCVKLDKLAGQQLYKETHQDNRTLEEIFTGSKENVAKNEATAQVIKTHSFDNSKSNDDEITL